jgi:hypothetical protein
MAHHAPLLAINMYEALRDVIAFALGVSLGAGGAGHA